MLADIPASFPQPDNAGLYLMMVVVLIPTVGKLVIDVFKWLGQRTVDREEEDKKSLTARVEKLEQSLDPRFEKQAEAHRLQLKEHTASIVEKISQMDQDLRQDMSRSIADVMRELNTPRSPRKR